MKDHALYLELHFGDARKMAVSSYPFNLTYRPTHAYIYYECYSYIKLCFGGHEIRQLSKQALPSFSNVARMNTSTQFVLTLEALPLLGSE